jgi:hypothetical protein
VRTSKLVAVALVVAAAAAEVSTAPAAGIALRTTVIEAKAASAPAGAVMLGGLSSRGWPVVLAVSADRKRIRFAVIGLDMTCSSGGSFAVDDAFATISVGGKGRVRMTQTIPPQTEPNASITGGSHSLYGRLDRKQLTFSGSWRLHVDFQLSGGPTDHCDSGQVSFAATL